MHFMVVTAMDTDILIILISLLGRQLQEDRKKIVIDCGFGNNRSGAVAPGSYWELRAKPPQSLF